MKFGTRQALQSLFCDQSEFIILGLTGRTGSGCSTTAELLTKSFRELAAPLPCVTAGADHEARKYSICYDYCQKNWRKFEIISMSEILLGFVLQQPRKDFENYLRTINTAGIENAANGSFFDDQLESEFDKLHETLQAIGGMPKACESGRNEVKEGFRDFYFGELRNFSKRLRDALAIHRGHLFTQIMQRIGDNVRASGTPYGREFAGRCFLALSEVANCLIKSIRLRSSGSCDTAKEKGPALVVIDAMRSPYEALFFRQRYANFYLLSINTPDSERVRRLHEKNYTGSEIRDLDAKEYPEELVDNAKFISQDIQKCIEIADIHISNPREDTQGYHALTRQLIRYVALMMHPGLVSPSKMERCMQVAYGAKVNSGCISRQVGAVVTDTEGSIRALGWNNAPSGQVPCALRSVDDLMRYSDKEAFSEYELSDDEFRAHVQEAYRDILNPSLDDGPSGDPLTGRRVAFCFKDCRNALKNEKNQVHTRSLHAEENAFLQLARAGGPGIQGGDLFSTASPCELCAKKAYQLGIRRVVYIDPYPGIAKSHIIESGRERPTFELFHGAVGRAFHALYEPMMPYKDELEILLGLKQ